MTHPTYATGFSPGRQTSFHIPAREVVTPSGSIVRGRIPSCKAGRMIAFEQLLERDALYLFEFSPQVLAIHEQPFKFFYADGAKTRRYTPDFALILSDRSQLVIEVKPRKSLAKPEVQAKLAAISEAMVRQGHRFLVLSDDVIRAEPRLSNLKRLFPHLSHPISDAMRRRLRTLVESPTQGGTLQVRALAELFGGAPAVFHLLAHGLIGTDSSQPIDQNSTVSLFPEEVDHVRIDWL